MEFEFMSEGKVKDAIKSCEGRHVQQIAYSSYHDAFTQICFNCKTVRTSIKEKDIKQPLSEEGAKK